MKKRILTPFMACMAGCFALLVSGCNWGPVRHDTPYSNDPQWKDYPADVLRNNRSPLIPVDKANAEGLAKAMAKRYGEDYACPELFPKETRWVATPYFVLYSLKDFDLLLIPHINWPFYYHGKIVEKNHILKTDRTLQFVPYILPKEAIPCVPGWVDIEFFTRQEESPLALPGLDKEPWDVSKYPKPVARALERWRVDGYDRVMGWKRMHPERTYSLWGRYLQLLPNGQERCFVMVAGKANQVNVIRVERSIDGERDRTLANSSGHECDDWGRGEVRMSDLMIFGKGSGVPIKASGVLGDLPEQIPPAANFIHPASPGQN